MSNSYQDLDIYKISFDLFLQVHKFSLRLPGFELHELGSQLRRSSDSVNTNIVEGYGRRNYKKDFIRFLAYSHASNDETLNHLKKIKILYPDLYKEATDLIAQYELLGKRIYTFVQYVKSNWKT